MSKPSAFQEQDDKMAQILWDKTKVIGHTAWAKTTRRIKVFAAFVLLMSTTLCLFSPSLQSMQIPRMPKISLEYQQILRSSYNDSKVALLIENRPLPVLAPLMLHFISVVPPDWRFRFMGSNESVEFISRSKAIREQVEAGKLDLTYIPANMSTAGQEQISRFLTTRWVYETLLQPAEWLLVFQSDSILCANSRQNLNDFLEFDWVGAPWKNDSRYGGNGGLSLRRVSAILQILEDQIRTENSDPEDIWLTERLGHRPGAKMANGTVSLVFSGEQLEGKAETVRRVAGSDAETGEGPIANTSVASNATLEAAKKGEYVAGLDDWRHGFYEPMGYHIGGSGGWPSSGIWGTPQSRQHIWNYCPEVKMTLEMDVAQFVPGNCNAYWKRSMDGTEAPSGGSDVDIGYGTEVIDGVEYPMLPPGLAPW